MRKNCYVCLITQDVKHTYLPSYRMGGWRLEGMAGLIIPWSEVRILPGLLDLRHECDPECDPGLGHLGSPSRGYPEIGPHRPASFRSCSSPVIRVTHQFLDQVRWNARRPQADRECPPQVMGDGALPPPARPWVSLVHDNAGRFSDPADDLADPVGMRPLPVLWSVILQLQRPWLKNPICSGLAPKPCPVVSWTLTNPRTSFAWNVAIEIQRSCHQPLPAGRRFLTPDDSPVTQQIEQLREMPA